MPKRRAQTTRLSTGLSGVAGEYFVAAELSRLGYIASLTLKNTRGIDILASNADATRSVGIQVKARQDAGTNWVLNKKDEKSSRGASHLFFVFVSLNGGDTPFFHIVPKNVVARFIHNSHRRWLRTLGRNGRRHVDTAMRKFADRTNKYRDAWSSLGL